MSQPMSPDQPGLTPPPGITPDFQDPYSVQPFLTLIAAFSIIITTTLVALRMFAKIRILKAVKWEDCESTLRMRSGSSSRLISFQILVSWDGYGFL